MSHPSFHVPEPLGPEHQLITEVAELPTLSDGLRDRVRFDCQRQVRLGRNADRMRVLAAVVAASLLVSLTWHFRWTGRSDDVPTDRSTAVDTVSPGFESPGRSVASPDEQPQLPQGGPPQKAPEDVREIQQINRLIEQLTERQSALCGVLPGWR